MMNASPVPDADYGMRKGGRNIGFVGNCNNGELYRKDEIRLTLSNSFSRSHSGNSGMIKLSNVPFPVVTFKSVPLAGISSGILSNWPNILNRVAFLSVKQCS